MAILVRIAIDKGYLESVHQKALDFFPEYKLKRNQEQLKDVTIEIQVLSNIIAKATDMSLKEFAAKYLFEPLEIKDGI